MVVRFMHTSRFRFVVDDVTTESEPVDGRRPLFPLPLVVMAQRVDPLFCFGGWEWEESFWDVWAWHEPL
jgi:hypothetical protein